MKRLVLVVTLLASTVAFAEAGIAQMWTARGLQAIEKMKALRARMEGRKAKSRQDDYQAVIEFSYAVHATDPEIAQKGEGTAFHIVLKSKAGELFNARYQYARGATASDKPIAIAIDMLPKGWRVFASAVDPSTWIVMPESGVLISFPLSDPFNITAVAEESPPVK